MAVTFAHPAAAIPLRRWGLPFSALVVGSMAPDFVYYTYLPLTRDFTHSFAGLILFCLPSSLIALWLLHRILARPILSLLPEQHRLRLEPLTGRFRFGPTRRLALVVLAILLGALTHNAWDSFTDFYRLPARIFPVLRAPIIKAFGTDMRLQRILYHAGTILAGTLLTAWYTRWFRTAPVGESARPWSPAAKAVIAGLLLCGSAFLACCHTAPRVPPTTDLRTVAIFAQAAVIAAVCFLTLACLVFSLAWQAAARCRPKRPDARKPPS